MFCYYISQADLTDSIRDPKGHNQTVVRNHGPSTYGSWFDKNMIPHSHWWYSLGCSRETNASCVPNASFNDIKLDRKGDAFYRYFDDFRNCNRYVFSRNRNALTFQLRQKFLRKFTHQLMDARTAATPSYSFTRFHSKRISLKVSCGSYYWWDWMQIQSGGDRTPVFCSFSENSFTCNFDRDENCNIKLLKPRYYVHKWKSFSTLRHTNYFYNKTFVY